MQPVAKTVQWIPLKKQQSVRFRDPITLERMVVSLLSSHQSTLGLPVQPAALSTCVGLSSSRVLETLISHETLSPVGETTSEQLLDFPYGP